MDRTSFQESFVDSITQGSFDKILEENIIPVGQLNVSKVLNVYRTDYQSRLTEALGESFESVWAVIGDDEFYELCKNYIKQYPSSYEELGEIGVNLPNYLSRHELSSDYPFLKELAQFEIDFWSTFHAKSHSVANDDSSISENDLLSSTYEFTKTFKLFTWNYCIFDLWELRKVGFENCDQNFDEEQKIAMFKTNKKVEVLKLSNDQYQIINDLMCGKTLSDSLVESYISSEELQSLFFNLNKHKAIKLKV